MPSIHATSVALAAALTLGSLAALVAVSASPARAGTPVRWEYSCFKGYKWGAGPLDPETVTKQANALGAKGWEMVNGDGAGAYCFKRQLP